MFDTNQLYSFSLPMTVANTPHWHGHPGCSTGSGHTRGHYQLATATICSREIRDVGRISPCFVAPVQNYCDDHSRSTCLLWKRTLPIRWGSTLTTSISASRFTTTWPIWCFSFFTNITRLLHPLPKQKTCSRSSMIYIELMSCSRLNIRHHNELRLPLRYHLRKMMQSWLHHLRPTTHNLRRRPAPCPRPVRRPSMASRLMVRFNNNLGSSSLFTDFLPAFQAGGVTAAHHAQHARRHHQALRMDQ